MFRQSSVAPLQDSRDGIPVCITLKHSLFQAYSLVDREVGYCQGSAFIVGLLLMQVGMSGDHITGEYAASIPPKLLAQSSSQFS